MERPQHLDLGMVPLSGFGKWNVASFRIRIWEWGIFQDSDMGMERLSGL